MLHLSAAASVFVFASRPYAVLCLRPAGRSALKICCVGHETLMAISQSVAAKIDPRQPCPTCLDHNQANLGECRDRFLLLVAAVDAGPEAGRAHGSHDGRAWGEAGTGSTNRPRQCMVWSAFAVHRVHCGPELSDLAFEPRRRKVFSAVGLLRERRFLPRCRTASRHSGGGDKAMNGKLSAWSRRWRQIWRNGCSARELDALSPADRFRLSEDVGLAGTDLRRFHCTHDGPSRLMPQRLRALGIDPGYVKYGLPATYRDLERVCAGCKSSRRCERDLARGDEQRGMDSYCLNAPTINSLIVGRPT